jgi:hypothetical protein
MSIRRAVEAHIKFCLDPSFPSTTYAYPVVESLRLADRPIPAIIITAGSAGVAFPEQPDQLGNWKVPVTVVILSNLDATTVDVHSEVGYQVQRILEADSCRRHSKVQGLYVYELSTAPVGQSNEGRRMVTVLNYEAMVNYSPESSSP